MNRLITSFLALAALAGAALGVTYENKDVVLKNKIYKEPLRFINCRIDLSKVQAPNIFLIKSSGILEDVTTTGADSQILIHGSSNLTFRRITCKGGKIGIEGASGHPWSFKEESEERGILFNPNNMWVLGTNLPAQLSNYALDNSFIGNGTSTQVFKIDQYGSPGAKIWKCDIWKPLTLNKIEVTGIKAPKIIADRGTEFVISAGEQIFERGRLYHYYTYNPKYEIRNIRIEDSLFDGQEIAGISLYWVANFVIENNLVLDTDKDYAIGIEMGRGGVIRHNMALEAFLDTHASVIGLHGRIESVNIYGNDMPVNYNAHGHPTRNLKSDVAVGMDDRNPTPWLPRAIKEALVRRKLPADYYGDEERPIKKEESERLGPPVKAA